MNDSATRLKYLSGFGAHRESEAVEGALPVGQNSPQRPAFGLYAEQLSGSAFTAPRSQNLRSWLYRLRPAAMHAPFAPMPASAWATAGHAEAEATPDRLRWMPLAQPAPGTDFLDGLAARLMKQQTPLGAYLDPIADKLLVITSFIVLGVIDGVPMWLAIIVVSRDVLIITGYGIIVFLTDERPEVNPSLIGKWSTLLQLFTLGVALALLHNPKLMNPWMRDIFIGSTAVLTVLSGVQYIYRGFLWLQNKAPSISRIS